MRVYKKNPESFVSWPVAFALCAMFTVGVACTILMRKYCGSVEIFYFLYAILGVTIVLLFYAQHLSKKQGITALDTEFYSFFGSHRHMYSYSDVAALIVINRGAMIHHISYPVQRTTKVDGIKIKENIKSILLYSDIEQEYTIEDINRTNTIEFTMIHSKGLIGEALYDPDLIHYFISKNQNIQVLGSIPDKNDIIK